MDQDISQYEIPFEFERKFFVEKLPRAAREHGAPQIIVQSYIFAQAGYAVRIRLNFRGITDFSFPKFNDATDFVGAYERKVLAQLLDITAKTAREENIQATLAVKSPAVNGERYELEHALDLDVAAQILQRSGNLVLKQRYSLWIAEDGWDFDVFAGQNAGLIVAECERLSPVVDLQIPDFAITEVTADPRFTNDALSKEPWTQWDAQFRKELRERGPFFFDFHSA